MPNLRKIIDGKDISFPEFYAQDEPLPQKKASDDNEEQDQADTDPWNIRHQAAAKKGSPAAQHIANHITDPLEQTKEGFEGLTDAKLNYEMQKEKMRRQLLPVQSVIQHVNQLHQLQDQYGTHPVDPEVQNDANMGYQEERQGVPPNMQQTPGMMQQSRPDRNTAYPGAGPKIPTPPMGAEPAQQQSKGVASKPKGAGQAFPKNGGKAGSNADKKPGKGIEVHVKAATMAAPGASTPLRNTLASEKVRQMSSKCHMDAGGPGSGRRPGGGSGRMLVAPRQSGPAGWKHDYDKPVKLTSKPKGGFWDPNKTKTYENLDAGGPGSGRRPGYGSQLPPVPKPKSVEERTAMGKKHSQEWNKFLQQQPTRTGGYFLKQPGVARTKRTRYGEEFEAEGVRMAHMPTPTMSRTVSAPARMSTTQTGGNVRTRMSAKKKLEAKAPPGWEGTVKHMKSHPEIDNPWALAWYEKNKGDTPHHG